MHANTKNSLTGCLLETEDLSEDGNARRSLLGRVTDRFRAAFDTSARKTPQHQLKTLATTLPDGARSSIPPAPTNDPFYNKIMGGALAIVLERPEVVEKVWGVRGKENQYRFFRTVYDPQTRESVMRRLLNGFKSLFCGESSLAQQDWIKILNVANQLSTDKVIPASLFNKMIRLYQYQVQGKHTHDNIVAVHDMCLDETVNKKNDQEILGLGKILW